MDVRDEELSRALRATAGGLRPDVGTLVEGGLARGVRKRRARRRARMGGSVAGVVAACAALVVVGPHLGGRGGGATPVGAAGGSTSSDILGAPGHLRVSRDFVPVTLKQTLEHVANVDGATTDSSGTPTASGEPNAFGGMRVHTDAAHSGWIQVEIGAGADPARSGWSLEDALGAHMGEIQARYVRSDGSWLEVREYPMDGAKAAPLDKDQLKTVMTNVAWGPAMDAAVTASETGIVAVHGAAALRDGPGSESGLY